MLPKTRKLERIAVTDRLVQPTLLDISALVDNSLRIITWVFLYCKAVRFGAMLERFCNLEKLALRRLYGWPWHNIVAYARENPCL